MPTQYQYIQLQLSRSIGFACHAAESNLGYRCPFSGRVAVVAMAEGEFVIDLTADSSDDKSDVASLQHGSGIEQSPRFSSRIAEVRFIDHIDHDFSQTYHSDALDVPWFNPVTPRSRMSGAVARRTTCVSPRCHLHLHAPRRRPQRRVMTIKTCLPREKTTMLRRRAVCGP